MNFKTYLYKSKAEIEKEAVKNLLFWEKQAGKINSKLPLLIRLFIESMEGGKCLRGTMVKLGYGLAKAPKNSSIITAAAAYEILHCSLLAHDDIMDQSLTRRGKKSLYQSLGGNHYGISQAICLGDFGIFLATELLNASSFNVGKKNRALAVFNQTCINTAFGQMLDIELPRQKNPTEREIINIYNLKTANYSIVGPMLVGAILGGANDNLLTQLKLFGQNLGIAYQIKDDILGVFGDEKELGKSVTSDIEEGKSTLLYVYSIHHANPHQKSFLEKYYGKGKITAGNLLMIKKIFIESGALEYSETKALSYVTTAKNVVPSITKNTNQQTLLIQLADLLINRSK